MLILQHPHKDNMISNMKHEVLASNLNLSKLLKKKVFSGSLKKEFFTE